MVLREKVLDRIHQLDQEKRRITNPLPESLDDQSIAIENDEVVDTLDKKERVELKSINSALLRIKGGTFGFCATCGAKIGKKRLDAIPYALQCIECEKSSNLLVTRRFKKPIL